MQADPRPAAVTSGFGLGVIASPVIEAINVLRRRRGTVLLAVMTFTSLALLLGFLLPPQFTATATVMISARQTRVVNLDQVQPDLPGNQETLDTELNMVKARPIATQVMEDMDLFHRPVPRIAKVREWLQHFASRVTGGPAATDVVNSLLARDHEPAARAAGVPLDNAGAVQKVPAASEELSIADREALIDKFLDRLQARQLGGTSSRVISVSFSAPDPLQAAMVTNRVAAVYVEEQLKEKRAATHAANDWLTERLQAMQDEVQQAERTVASFQAAHQLSEVRGTGLAAEQLVELNHELVQVRAELAGKTAKLNKISELQASAGDLSSLHDVLNSLVIEELRKQEAELDRQRGEYETQYGERHPKMLALQEARANINGRVHDEIARIVSGLQDDLSVTEAREQNIERDLEAARATFVADGEAEVRLRELEREATAKRDIYRALLTRYQETTAQEGLLTADARIVSMAAVPPMPSTPSPMVFGFVGFVLACVLGSMLALLCEHLDDTTRSSRQIEGLFELPVLGLVPRVARRRGQSLHTHLLLRPRSHYAEVASTLCRVALADSGNRLSKIVLVTSALPGEGKTSLAACLAVCAAGLGKRVVLVDLDLRRPLIADAFGLWPTFDLATYRPDEDLLSSLIVRDDATGVDVLPTERGAGNVGEFLMSQRLHRLLQGLRSRYDYIILDSPPVLGLVDSQILARHADVVIFAVCWARTKLTAVAAGLKALSEVNAHLIGAVLTQVNMKRYARARYGDAAEHYQHYSECYMN